MQSILKALRNLGPVGSAAANVLSFLTNNWALTVSVIIGLYASLTDWAVSLAANPRFQAGVIFFLGVLWTSIGILMLVDRRRPRVSTPAEDYRYGLTFEGLFPVYDPTRDEGTLVFGIQLRNFSSGPLRYTIEKFDVQIGTRSLPKLKKGVLTSFMPRGAGRTSTHNAFKKTDIIEFKGKKTEGTVDFSIAYGHPDKPPVRVLSMSIAVSLEFSDEEPSVLGFGSHILEETDQPIKDR